MSYAFSRTVPLSFEDAVKRVTEELKKEGFGVLTTIDVRETLKQKLNVDFHNYVILGACNPSFAYQALQSDEQIGLLLPCNVTVSDKGGTTVVAAFDPMSMAAIMENDSILPIARQVESKLRRVIDAVA